MNINYLFVPAEKLSSLGSFSHQYIDVAVIDLEDSVNTKMKNSAREELRNFDFSGINDVEYGIRINRITTSFGVEDINLIASLMENKRLNLKYVFIPKVENHHEIKIYIDILANISSSFEFIPVIETVSSLDYLDEIAALSNAIIFGQADMSAELYQPNETFIKNARAKICMVAAKYNIAAIDTNSFSLNDNGILRKECEVAHEEGFVAKAIIHPKQAKTVNDVFSVESELLDKYKRCINSYERSTKGFFIDDGQIVAPPFVSKAKKLLKFYADKKINHSESTGIGFEAYEQISVNRYRESKGFYYEDFDIGVVIEHSPGRTITATDNIWFSLISMNQNPLHIDAQYAENSQFNNLLVSSLVTFNIVNGLTVHSISQRAIANLGWGNVKLIHPVFVGDTLYAESKIIHKRVSQSNSNHGIVKVKTVGRNQNNEPVIRFTRTILIPRKINKEVYENGK